MGFYFILNFNFNLKKEKIFIYSLLELVYLATNQLFSFFCGDNPSEKRKKIFFGEKN